MAPGALAQVLCGIEKTKDENLLVGFDTSDDACIYRITDDVATVMTVDFFPPMVDDPYIFGQIAATNALSDVYAMGGTPTHAMNLLCFPGCLDLSVAHEILAGGAQKAAEANCVIAGGHTIVDNEPKYGLCVSGLVNPNRILTNSGAKVGDRLILTKKLGTGIVTTAVKGEFLCEEDIKEVVDGMRTLNRYAAEIAAKYSVHACTDITGFGAVGHICEMAEGSGVCALIDSNAIIPLPNALDMASVGMIPAGAYRNRDYFAKRVNISGNVPSAKVDLLFDPQTSGGLLFAVSANDANELLSHLFDAGICAAQIGEIEDAGEFSVRVK